VLHVLEWVNATNTFWAAGATAFDDKKLSTMVLLESLCDNAADRGRVYYSIHSSWVAVNFFSPFFFFFSLFYPKNSCLTFQTSIVSFNLYLFRLWPSLFWLLFVFIFMYFYFFLNFIYEYFILFYFVFDLIFILLIVVFFILFLIYCYFKFYLSIFYFI
jgi:hypothetical protein